MQKIKGKGLPKEIKAKTDHYGFTFKINDKCNPSQEDYQPLLKMLSKKGQIVDFVYELDSKKKLHLHGIVEFKKNPYFKNMMYKGCHTFYEPLWNESEWKHYMQKHQKTYHEESQKADSLYTQKHYII